MVGQKGTRWNKIPQQESKSTVTCIVPGCNKTFRKDKINNKHYNVVVKCDNSGLPLRPGSLHFNELECDIIKSHTKYFYENKLDPKTSKECLKADVPKLTPFQQMVLKRAGSSGDSGEPGPSKISRSDAATAVSSESSRPDGGKSVEKSGPDADDNTAINLSDIESISDSDKESGKELSAQQETRKEDLSAMNILQSKLTTEMVQEATNYQLDDATKKELIEEISRRVTENVTEYFDDKNKVDENKDAEIWIAEDDGSVCCKPCLLYKNKDNRPLHLKSKGAGNNYGRIHFSSVDERSKWTHKEQKKRKRDHTNNPLHVWCVEQMRLAEVTKTKTIEKDKKASEIIAGNAVFCILENMSSEDFVKLNSKSQMEFQDDYPTKNDGRQHFFTIRDIVYEHFSTIARERLRVIKSASFSLDKVTIKNVPYTVLVTYYMWKGELQVFLNSIHKMASYEYSGEATAKMIGEDLMSSLGLRRQEIASIFVHAVYDGVYATPEERKNKRGGSLSLKTHFANWCDVDPEMFSGSWDLGHVLQLVYSDVLKNDKNVAKFNSTMYKHMSDWKSGQTGLRFAELAHEMNFATLTNKSHQETRWVRAELRSLQTMLRNLPVFVAMYAKEEEKCMLESDITGQKDAKGKREELCNLEFVSFAVGLAQILEGYAACSLEVQNFKLLPTQCPEKLRQLRSYLQNLATWKWVDKDLRLAGVGNPAEIMSTLRNGKFSPAVSKGAKNYAAKHHKAEQLFQEQRHSELSYLGEIIISNEFESQTDITSETIQCGEIFFEFSEVGLNGVEKKLEALVESLLKSLDSRVDIPDLWIKAEQAFINISWFSEETVDDVLKEKICDILEQLKSFNKSKYEECIEEISLGYRIFLKHASQMTETASMPLSNVYKSFCQKYSIEETGLFKEMFDHINVRSYSEAMCETIGSIMGISVSRSRNILPLNLHKEVFLLFNLPPYPVLQEKGFVKEIAEKWSNTITNEKSKFFRLHDKRSGLKLSHLSSSIETYRKKCAMSGHFPSDLL